MAFTNPMDRTSKARGSRINMGGKQKRKKLDPAALAEISHEQQAAGNGTTSMVPPLPMMPAMKKGGVVDFSKKEANAKRSPTQNARLRNRK